MISLVWLDNPKESKVIPRPFGRGITFDPFGLSSHTKKYYYDYHYYYHCFLSVQLSIRCAIICQYVS